MHVRRARTSRRRDAVGACVLLLSRSSSPRTRGAGDSLALTPQWTQAIVDAERPVQLLPAPRGAVLLQTDASLTSWAYDGRLRWRYVLCPGCRFEAVATAHGGGAWLVEADVPPVAGRAPYRLIELDGSGGVVFELALDRVASPSPRDDSSSSFRTMSDGLWNRDVASRRHRLDAPAADRSESGGRVEIDEGRCT